MAKILPASPDVVHRKRGPFDENSASSAFMANIIDPPPNATPQFGATDKKARHFYTYGEDNNNADSDDAMATKRGRMMIPEEHQSPSLSSALISSSSVRTGAGGASLFSSSSSSSLSSAIPPAGAQQGWSSASSMGLSAHSELGYMRSQVASLRAQLEMTTQQSQQQVAQLRALNGQLVHGAERIQAEKSRLEEDNKILKKAVAIHDSRQREKVQTNNQLQYLLQQAIAQINVLNQENRQLKAQLSPRTEYSQTRDVFPHGPPPDVF